jgi:hypothetical protein
MAVTYLLKMELALSVAASVFLALATAFVA